MRTRRGQPSAASYLWADRVISEIVRDAGRRRRRYEAMRRQLGFWGLVFMGLAVYYAVILRWLA